MNPSTNQPHRAILDSSYVEGFADSGIFPGPGALWAAQARQGQCLAGGAASLPPALRRICEVEYRKEGPLAVHPALHAVSGSPGVGLPTDVEGR